MSQQPTLTCPSWHGKEKFRDDLLDRLAFDVITLPPLRERLEDIPVLARHFAINMIKELEREYFPGFSKAAAKALLSYPWPGNVRELKNVIERCVYQSEEPDKPVRDIVFDPFASPYRPGSAKPASPDKEAAVEENDENVSADDFDFGAIGFKHRVQEFEKKILRRALKECQFNQRKTAKLLNLSYDQLRGYMRKYDLNKLTSALAIPLLCGCLSASFNPVNNAENKRNDYTKQHCHDQGDQRANTGSQVHRNEIKHKYDKCRSQNFFFRQDIPGRKNNSE